MVERRSWIPMEDGVRLAASLLLPEAATSGGTVPVVLEALPYRKDDATASYRPEYERLCGEYGYAVARVDLTWAQGKTSFRIEWPEAAVATGVRLDLRGDAEAFEVRLDLEAREGDELRWARSWHRRTPRRLG